MAAAETRKLLGEFRSPMVSKPINNNREEQLMGANALNEGADQRARQLDITDPQLCRSYMVGTCPHDLFTNTKQDFGPCPKMHSEAHKTEYQEADAAQQARWGFKFDYLEDMKKHVHECDRRINLSQQRLEKTPEEIRKSNNLVCVLALSFAPSG